MMAPCLDKMNMKKGLYTDLNEIKSAFEKRIDQDGELWFLPNFLSAEEAFEIEQLLLNTIEWKQGEIHMFGKKHLEPRKTAWYGDEGCVYTYAGKKSHPIPWNDALMSLKKRVETFLPGVNFNSVLLNLYRDGRDKMGWHSDNEKELGKNPMIASLSLGAPRFFDLKHKQIKTLKKRFELPSGSLLIMCGNLQENWLHQVPPQKRVSEVRINLTFRDIKTKNEKS